MTPFNIYLWQMADQFILSIGILSLILGLISGFCLLFGVIEDEGGVSRCGFKISIPVIMLFLLWSLMPSSKTIAMMYVLPRIAESKAVQTDLPELYEAAMAALKEQIGIAKK